MTNFDKALHLVGMISGGLVVAHATGQLPLPGWAAAVFGVFAYASGATAAKIGTLGARVVAPPAEPPPAPPAA